MSAVVTEIHLFLFLASLAGAFLVFPAPHAVPVHYDFYSQPDMAVAQGQVIYPVCFFFFFLGSLFPAGGRSGGEAALLLFKNTVTLGVSLLLAVLQCHASLVGMQGASAPALPWWVCPVCLGALAVVVAFGSVVVGCSGDSSAKNEEDKKTKTKRSASPRSPRGLIRMLASPDEAESHSRSGGKEEEEVERVRTPMRRGKSGRSPVRTSPRRRTKE